jgi:hypothetical protein
VYIIAEKKKITIATARKMSGEGVKDKRGRSEFNN